MLRESPYVKIVVAVPLDAADGVRDALTRAGAGRQGNYEACSGSYRQTGRFRPREGAKPAIGSVGKLEEVEEEVIEAICHRDLVARAVEEVKKAHPYEEPAIDIIPRLEIS
ncbi:MAG: hypothetical protein AB1352_02975 [Patescibacteria group bacterium]